MPIYLKDHYQKKKNIKESKEVNAAGTKYLKTSLLRLLIFYSTAFIKTEKTGFRWDKYRLRRIKTCLRPVFKTHFPCGNSRTRRSIRIGIFPDQND